MINEKDYVSYLVTLKNSIYKILPLYEEGSVTLANYVLSVSFELSHVSKVTDKYDGAWLIKNLAVLKGLEEEVKKPNNQPFIKSKVLGILNTIDKQIQKAKEV